jgi:chaperone required for assembly of F1-ATPase
MRDIFEDIFENQPLDPTEAARRNMRPNLRGRFYKAASVGETEGGFTVLLDGRPVRTPARRSLVFPSRPLAEAVAAEWEAQNDKVDPAVMPLTRLANTIIDGVQPSPVPVADEIAKYLRSDLLFYRAAEPAGLVDKQRQHWDGVLDWARDNLGARFMLAEGVMHVAQPDSAVAAASSAIPDSGSVQDVWRLGAVSVVTTLTGSALLALALAAGRITADEVWAAAHVDEEWNMSFWGRDELALQRREHHFKEMQAASLVLALLR